MKKRSVRSPALWTCVCLFCYSVDREMLLVGTITYETTSFTPMSCVSMLQDKMDTSMNSSARSVRRSTDVFRKLKQLDYLTSYSIALATTRCEIPRFAADGLWSGGSVVLPSRHAAATPRSGEHSSQGYFAEELAECLHVEVQDALYHLVEQRRIARQQCTAVSLCSSDPVRRRRQLLTRSVQTVRTWWMRRDWRFSGRTKSAILLFYRQTNSSVGQRTGISQTGAWRGSSTGEFLIWTRIP